MAVEKGTSQILSRGMNEYDEYGKERISCQRNACMAFNRCLGVLRLRFPVSEVSQLNYVVCGGLCSPAIFTACARHSSPDSELNNCLPGSITFPVDRPALRI